MQGSHCKRRAEQAPLLQFRLPLAVLEHWSLADGTLGCSSCVALLNAPPHLHLWLQLSPIAPVLAQLEHCKRPLRLACLHCQLERGGLSIARAVQAPDSPSGSTFKGYYLQEALQPAFARQCQQAWYLRASPPLQHSCLATTLELEEAHALKQYLAWYLRKLCSSCEASPPLLLAPPSSLPHLTTADATCKAVQALLRFHLMQAKESCADQHSQSQPAQTRQLSAAAPGTKHASSSSFGRTSP